MKNNFIKTLALATFFILASCAKDAKSSYELLRSEYELIFVNSKSYDDIVTFNQRIDNHLSQFPSYEGNEDLKTIKKTLIKRSDEIIYNSIQESHDKCYGERFRSYDEARERLMKLRDELNLYSTQSNSLKNSQLIEKYLADILNSLENIAEEAEDYLEALSSKNVENYLMFLETHPNSIMKLNIQDKLDDIYYDELISEYNRNVSTIEELNENQKLATNYLYKFYSLEKKNSVSELISYLETRRKPVLQMEMDSKLSLLFNEMEDEVSKIVKVSFADFEIESIRMLNEDVNEKTNSKTYTRNYRLSIYKDFFGFRRNRREVTIGVEGRIQGDTQNGVIISVKGTRIG